MSEETRTPISNRYDFSVLYDVENGNPNGDPDSGNMPRVDPETGLGLVTDVCLKRKIRNYVQMINDDKAPWRIYIKEQVPLNRMDAEALKSVGLGTDSAAIKKAKKDNAQLDQQVLDYMCSNFFDIRTFGAVMTTFVKGGLSSGQVRGPVQLGFSKSIDPITPQDVTITRVSATTEADQQEKGSTMGNKSIIPYGLYRVDGFVNAKLAQKTTGFSEEDLAMLWQSILNMFEFDRSAARGKMAVRKLYVFKHSNDLGDAPSYKLFDSIHVAHKPEVETPRSFTDYDVSVDSAAIPQPVELTEMVDGLQ
ncbi:type I-C CRISPR-associated protein Cas7/Csd2 [Bombiscardovia apis]|uniref:Type I-C CRISPR-associated protein Cas7/Csd2 n=1 Tax=Bombiscardovia apis TaxID=2932182 RepID=A0ABN6SJG5_9BIFI|nr:type I-C CRISPR-associated protein Cas7/Csd2 [Bombiscardovia apis]BDR55228.1 type I-C CRISPR-associated protein Cas7/Csd2 [Bombiscardovia apis]